MAFTKEKASNIPVSLEIMTRWVLLSKMFFLFDLHRHRIEFYDAKLKRLI